MVYLVIGFRFQSLLVTIASLVLVIGYSDSGPRALWSHQGAATTAASPAPLPDSSRRHVLLSRLAYFLNGNHPQRMRMVLQVQPNPAGSGYIAGFKHV